MATFYLPGQMKIVMYKFLQGEILPVFLYLIQAQDFFRRTFRIAVSKDNRVIEYMLHLHIMEQRAKQLVGW
jgi:hypothetical protein